MKNKSPLRIFLYLPCLVALATGSAGAADSLCERTCVNHIVNDYVEALVASDPSVMAGSQYHRQWGHAPFSS